MLGLLRWCTAQRFCMALIWVFRVSCMDLIWSLLYVPSCAGSPLLVYCAEFFCCCMSRDCLLFLLCWVSFIGVLHRDGFVIMFCLFDHLCWVSFIGVLRSGFVFVLYFCSCRALGLGLGNLCRVWVRVIFRWRLGSIPLRSWRHGCPSV